MLKLHYLFRWPYNYNRVVLQSVLVNFRNPCNIHVINAIIIMSAANKSSNSMCQQSAVGTMVTCGVSQYTSL